VSCSLPYSFWATLTCFCAVSSDLPPVDELLQTCLDFVPSADSKPTSLAPGGGAVVSLWPTALVPKSAPPYVHYAGSLTTPPCTEGVDWFVLTNPVTVDLGLVERFREFSALNGGKKGKDIRDFGNARPPQRPNNRLIDYEI
jgi:carbonic anhydrase